MPGLKGRLSTVVKSKVSKQLDRAENPSETLDYAYQRQVENLQNVKKGIADIVTAKKRLALQQQQLGEQGAKLDAQAREAMSAGREDLARAALERKQLAVQEAGSLDQQIAQLESEQEKLIESEKQLAGEDRAVPLKEGSHQGPVLGCRGAGADFRGGHRSR